MAGRNGRSSTAELEQLRADLSERTTELGQYAGTVELLTERLAELELSIEDTGWLRQGAYYEREFSPGALSRLRRLARLSFLKNPLINHAVRVQANYVWGQGIAISAANAAVNDLVQAWLNDRRNATELTGHAARLVSEMELQVEGELVIALFTNISTGWVRPRKIHPDEISDIIFNPNDSKEPWFYKRTWSKQAIDVERGSVAATQGQTTYHPDWRYDPQAPDTVGKPSQIGGAEVRWDAPIYHVKTGGFSDMTRGVPEIYSALDWARAVKDDLEAYATIKRALARFAWNLQVKGGKGAVSAGKTKLTTTLGADGGSGMDVNPPPVTGSTFIGSEGATLQPMRTAGSAPSPDEGYRLWLMVSAGTGLPQTMLSGDTDVGNLATARSLDRPTELQMQNRQTLWADIYQDLFSYVIEQAVLHANGPLPGKLVTDRVSGQRRLVTPTDESGQPASYRVDIRFPSILEREPLDRVKAVVDAATLGATTGVSAGLLDDKTVTKLLLSALGVTEIDELLNELYPDNATDAAVRQSMQQSDLQLAAALREFRESVQPLIEQMQVLPRGQGRD